jgi:hypothetical protein
MPEGLYRMPLKRSFITVCSVLVILTNTVWGLSQSSPPSSRDLMEGAHKISDTAALQPYTLTAKISLPSDKHEHGTLTIYRDHDKARIELVLGKYHETRLVLGDHQYVRSAHAYIDAAHLTNFDRSWDPTQPLDPGSETRTDVWREASRRSVLDLDSWCLQTLSRNGFFTLCFDAQQSLLLERTEPSITMDFTSYQESGQAFFPTLVISRPEHLQEFHFSDVQITHGEIPPVAWVPAADAIDTQRCEPNVRPPQADSTPEPEFPPAARRDRKEALLLFYAVITAEGKVALPQPLVKDSYGFTGEALKAMKHWRFKPATCAGQPVNVLLLLEVDFRLRGH